MSEAKPLDADAAELLRHLMSEISEDHYCAGWLIGLEFRLWRIVLGGPPKFGFDDVSPERIADLERLSKKCGGWIVWSEGCGEVFVPMDEWQRMYAAEKGPAND